MNIENNIEDDNDDDDEEEEDGVPRMLYISKEKD